MRRNPLFLLCALGGGLALLIVLLAAFPFVARAISARIRERDPAEVLPVLEATFGCRFPSNASDVRVGVREMEGVGFVFMRFQTDASGLDGFLSSFPPGLTRWEENALYLPDHGFLGGPSWWQDRKATRVLRACIFSLEGSRISLYADRSAPDSVNVYLYCVLESYDSAAPVRR